VGVTLELPDHIMARLTAEADRRGIALADLVSDLAAQLPPADQPRRRRLVFVGVGASASGISHRIDDLLVESFGGD
jgi:hypothetical protein